ncbi:MAG: signal peptide peptidase SppA [Bacteroidota bacterium]
MKNFLKFLLASCLGTLLALGGLVFFSVWTATNIAKKVNTAEKVKPNTVLSINLNEPIPERTNNVPVNPYEMTLEQNDVLGLQDLLEVLEVAKEDDNIKGIYMELSQPMTGLASLSAIRAAVDDFKESGKFVVAYSGFYSQTGYYMASVADKVYINPTGSIFFNGFAAQVPFFKDMLDKIGVKAQVFYAGKFKSATEPFRRTEMSPENRLQIKEYLDENYQYFLEDISKSRDISVAELMRIADEFELRETEDAQRLNFVDGIMYKDQVLDELRDRLGLDKNEKITTMSLGAYHAAAGKRSNYKAKDKIAVVYAEGGIVDGEGEQGSIGGDKYARIIRKIRQDKKVKAIVLRVNSGGGSGYASENIWREMGLANEQGIKTVVSMGDVAASGGYYIACNSDKVFAQRNTITGSIGVFGLLPSMKELMNDKIGIRMDTVKTGKYATIGNTFYDLNPDESLLIQQMVDTFYQHFLERVADGRSMTVKEVNEVAQGRVWTGAQAKALGLIDEMGDLNAALKSAAELADLDEYRMVEYPKTKDPFTQLIEELTGKENNFANAMLKEELGDPLYQYFEKAKEIKKMSGIQARMPFDLVIR